VLTNVQAVLVFNTGTALLNVTIDLADLGLQGCAAAPLHCRSVAFSPWLGEPRLTSAAMCLAEPKTGVCNAARVMCGLIATCRRHSAALGL
jgi:hypothetical protein